MAKKDDLTTKSDEELLARNAELGGQRETILNEQIAIAAEIDRRVAEREERRRAELAAFGAAPGPPTQHVFGAPEGEQA